jgi:hypothetical protein
MDASSWALAVLTTVVVPTGGWLIRATLANTTKMATHDAEDTIHFKNIAERLTQLQEGLKNGNDKLDRLIERFL